MRFLVVDDSATMRRIIVNSLGRVGYPDVVEADDGQSALAKFSEGGIEFIVTDWNMPQMNGLDFARAVRARADGAHVPILMVTTRSAREDILAAVDAGVNNYVLKPFTPPVLKEKIDAVLSASAAA